MRRRNVNFFWSELTFENQVVPSLCSLLFFVNIFNKFKQIHNKTKIEKNERRKIVWNISKLFWSNIFIFADFFYSNKPW